MKVAGLVTLTLALGLKCAALGAQIEGIPWTDANIAQLNKSDKAAVAAFLNGLRGPGTEALNPYNISVFKWVDLAGDGKCELVLGTHWPALSATTIYWQESTGDFINQTLTGEVSLKDGIKDLNGDGKKEIIVDSYLDPTGRRAAGSATPVWPQVYRLQDEEYVPASAEFPGFYDLEILPKLDREIADTPPRSQLAAAALEMQRDKIRRVLGRDPNAGLEKARYWATTGDPQLIWDAVDVLRDIGGHEEELRTAEQAGKQAWQHWLATHEK